MWKSEKVRSALAMFVTVRLYIYGPVYNIYPSMWEAHRHVESLTCAVYYGNESYDEMRGRVLAM